MTSERESSDERPLIVIGLGANLGDRLQTIENGIQAIEALPNTQLHGRSSVWRTAPVGGPPQPDYYNAAVGVRTASTPPELMRALLAIEQRFGRVRARPNDPRTLDLDILWMEGLEQTRGWQETKTSEATGGPEGPPNGATAKAAPANGLRIPHPRLRERAFALVPLLEVVRDAVDPESGRFYMEILAELGTDGVTALDSTHA